MILAHRVALNGIELDEIDERINIKSVEEGAGKETISATGSAAGCGQRITNRRRDTLDIIVKFSMTITPEEPLQVRSELLETVNAWAIGGGILTVNYRPGRRVRVVCVQAPGPGDQYEWTTVYQLTFRAYAVPYWEEETPATKTSGVTSNASFEMVVNGNAETVADVTLQNMSGKTINNVTIRASIRTFTFTGLNMGGSDTLTIDHDDNGLLRMRIGDRSVMANRTPESDNDLRIGTGERTFRFTADRACRMTVSVRGRYV